MALWQDCQPECWEAWSPDFNPRPAQIGVQFLLNLGQPPKTFISYAILSVAKLKGVITLKSFIFIHFIIYATCLVCVCIKLPSYMSEPPSKKGVANSFKKGQNLGITVLFCFTWPRFNSYFEFCWNLIDKRHDQRIPRTTVYSRS